MVSSVPILDVFYIDFHDSEHQFANSLSKTSLALTAAATLATGPFGIAAAIATLNTGATALDRFVKENRFHIIKSNDELAHYENANGNAWVVNKKSLKQKQYYIRHPKKTNCNILIEAKSFYDYIEEEQKDELIDFIMSHCPAKCIRIDRVEINETNGRANVNVKGADLNSGVNYVQMRGNYYSYSNPNGVPKIEPRENYFWIDKSIMRSISALTDGASLNQTYENDFTFGLNAGEAKTIGLDLSRHKKYSYTIQIEC